MANNILPAPSVCFENVCLSRGGNLILDGICATAPAGGSTVIVGPNGAGKTTLLLCLIGELPFTGRIEFAGEARPPRVAYVPQHLSMDRSLPLRVSEFMALSCQRQPLWMGLRPFARDEGRHLLEMVKAVHLEQSRMGDLSGGELRRVLLAPFGYALRAVRDSALRADAIGMDGRRLQWAAFVVAGVFAGLAGALYVFSKGSISPEGLSVGKSVDGLVMVLLGGIQTLAGPVVGAVTFTWLHDTVARNTDYWRAVLGGTMLALVLLFPQGLAGFARLLALRWQARRSAP